MILLKATFSRLVNVSRFQFRLLVTQFLCLFPGNYFPGHIVLLKDQKSSRFLNAEAQLTISNNLIATEYIWRKV